MATLESKLEAAAMEGSVEKLQELLQHDPLLLDARVADPPLHIAAFHGHAGFVDAILQQKPQLARVFDGKGSCPLHLAAANGCVETVRILLRVDTHTCLFRNSDGLNPLQLAAMNGHVDALKELVEAKPEAAQAQSALDRRGNALHLCVINNQLEALKVLVAHAAEDHDLINSKDDFGCSIFSLAVLYKQKETIKFLVNTNGIELDGLLQNACRDQNNMITAESPAAVRLTEPPPNLHLDSENSSSRRRKRYRNGEGGERRLMRQREALMVVASVVATMAFQAAINPPGGVWKDAEKSTIHPVRFGCFVSSITFSFVFSIIELFLLISDYPSTVPLFLRFLAFAKILSIGGMTVAYAVAILCLT